MNLDEIMTLVKAGYTKADIEALQRPAEDIPAAMPEETPEPVAEPEATQQADHSADLLKEIQDLKKALQLKNIHTDEKSPEMKESAEDILIKLLNGAKGE